MTTLPNTPDVWKDSLPHSKPDGHKYDRGVAVIYGAPKMTGATRLAARACARMGAGLVKVIAPTGTGDIYRSTLHEEIIVTDEADFDDLKDSRITSFLMGPGCPPDPLYGKLFYKAMEQGRDHIKGVVLDAGAFTVWASNPLEFRAISNGDVVVTPHEGEFGQFAAKLPDAFRSPEKVERAGKVAQALDCVVVLKGPQTVVAGEGETIVQDRPLPQLATGGTGDVLAGMITGLLAQGMDAKMAAAAAVWIHGEAAARFGAGLVSSDLPDCLPPILSELGFLT